MTRRTEVGKPVLISRPRRSHGRIAALIIRGDFCRILILVIVPSKEHRRSSGEDCPEERASRRINGDGFCSILSRAKALELQCNRRARVNTIVAPDTGVEIDFLLLRINAVRLADHFAESTIGAPLLDNGDLEKRNPRDDAQQCPRRAEEIAEKSTMRV